VILAVLSAVVYSGVLAYACTRDLRIAPLTAAIGGIGGVLLLFALLRRVDDVMPWAIVLLGGAYAVSLFVRNNGIDEAAPLVGAGLLLCSELAAWSFDERWRIKAERSVVAARGIAVVLLVLAGLGASGLVIGLAAAPIGGGLGWTVLGAAAAVLVIGLAARLSR
jgi:hypothetical protein